MTQNSAVQMIPALKPSKTPKISLCPNGAQSVPVRFLPYSKLLAFDSCLDLGTTIVSVKA
jgi:hypothetical protein